MSAEKARKLSLIRQGIRSLANAENDEKQRVELKRIVVASERKRVGICDTAPPVTIDELEEKHLIQLQEMPDADTPEYWQDVFDVLATDEASEYYGNESTQIDVDDSMSEGSQCSHAEEIEQNLLNGFDESIPEPDTTAFSRSNVKTFPQETKLTGIRGQKFSLMTHFPSENTFELAPYIAALRS
ncbi:hypothetical protein PHYPSEUDO_009894 [Phytophthora pseudosyringae]|uniref:Uncharacterized protein n=1 Tax=Phytophthora pseudosyringae TaxID=221518 RepID=A0A8T1VCB8_9STRA|nr:hypothetical protein PHYPSEUDO_009894 [Phytophthora pseudosyringae]